MENNYHFRRNEPQPSQSQIEASKDFDKLMEVYESTPNPNSTTNTNMRWLRWGTGAVAAAMLGFILWTGIFKNDANVPTTAFVAPPIPAADVQFAKYTIPAEAGGQVKHKNGTTLDIPVAAFVDAKGQAVVTGDIDIKYREMHDFVDFFLSGIPMHYDSAGTRYQLVSGGMMEVYAEQNGERLELSPMKEIAVTMQSEVNVKVGYELPAYNVYVLNEKARNWEYKGINNVEILEKIGPTKNEGAASVSDIENAENVKVVQQELETLENSVPMPAEPSKPVKANGKDYVFDLDIDDYLQTNVGGLKDKEFRKMENQYALLRKQYNGVLWQVEPNQAQFNDTWAKRDWDNFEIVPIDEQRFRLTLKANAETVTVDVRPVLNNKEYEKAMATFNDTYNEYQGAIAKREAQLKNSRAEIQSRFDEAKALAKLDFETRQAKLKAEGKLADASNDMVKHKILNRFKVSSMGIWNCDRPLPPDMNILKGTFVDNLKTKYSEHPVYLVNKSDNTVRSFDAYDGCAVQFSDNDDNLMWLITDDNKLAVYRPQDFNKITKQTGTHTFVMNVAQQSIQNEQDIRQVLAF